MFQGNRHAAWRAAAVLFGGVALLMPPHADAQESKDWMACKNANKSTAVEQIIAGCDALIKSEQGRNLAIAHYHRANAYRIKGDLDGPSPAMAKPSSSIRN